jgi:hypothetical protein
MMTLIAAALAAAQPAPPADAHARMMAEHQAQHAANKEKCCCDDMAKGDHAMDADHHDGEHGAN